MAVTPQFSPIVVSAGQAGWDAQVNANFAQTKQWLHGQPTQCKRAYRVSSTSVPHKPDVIDLKDFSPAQYEGCMVYLLDAQTPATNGHIAYSDGSNWIYARTGTSVTGIA